jgi:glutamate-1-semialdehyde 2,1-aminomutase
MAEGKTTTRRLLAPRLGTQDGPPLLAGPQSRLWFARGCRVIPGGVNSPVRAWKRLGGSPPVLVSGKGAYTKDADGKERIDYILSWGPLLHGHAHPTVVKAVQQAAALGLGFGAPTPGEVEMAELLTEAIPSMEQVRLVSSGTEACMSAIRVARAATSREVIIKFDGCYHGHSDHLLVAAGSGLATFGTPDSSGVPAAIAARTVSVPYNDAAAVEMVLNKHRNNVAAVMVEPVAGNMGFVLPKPGFLKALRDLTTRHGSLLIFDEVMTGFRVGWGGWQNQCGVTPDLTCLAKVIGGGLPLAAYGGRRNLMQLLSPIGNCYQAGTLSGNPVAVAAGLATLRLAQAKGFYEKTAERLTTLIDGLRELAAKHHVPMQLAQAGTMWGFFFNEREVTDMRIAQRSDDGRWRVFVTEMHQHGVTFAPSPYEASFFSAAHGPAEIKATLKAADAALFAVANAFKDDEEENLHAAEALKESSLVQEREDREERKAAATRADTAPVKSSKLSKSAEKAVTKPTKAKATTAEPTKAEPTKAKPTKPAPNKSSAVTAKRRPSDD